MPFQSALRGEYHMSDLQDILYFVATSLGFLSRDFFATLNKMLKLLLIAGRG